MDLREPGPKPIRRPSTAASQGGGSTKRITARAALFRILRRTVKSTCRDSLRSERRPFFFLQRSKLRPFSGPFSVQKSGDRLVVVSRVGSRCFGDSIAACAKRSLSSAGARSYFRPHWRCFTGRAGVESARCNGLLCLLLLPDPVLHQHFRLRRGGSECRQG